MASRHVQINFEPDVLFPITIDEKLMGRVINNILENGIKYSGAGSIITIKTEDVGDFVALTISDNGVGIDEKELKYIFEKFYRLKNEKIPGNGLGLDLVKYFVELMEGQIKVQSKVSEELVLSSSDEQVKEKELEKVLVVDDDQVLRESLQKALRFNGFLVKSATNGQEAVNACKEKFDLVVMDVNMPLMDGLEALLK